MYPNNLHFAISLLYQKKIIKHVKVRNIRNTQYLAFPKFSLDIYCFQHPDHLAHIR